MRPAEASEKCRKPTIAEAVEWVSRALTREYQTACLRFYREKYGEAFASAVERGVKWRSR